MKKEYHLKNQEEKKEKMKKLENIKRIKAFNKSQKCIIRKRAIFLDYPQNNKKIKHAINENNDIDLLY